MRGDVSPSSVWTSTRAPFPVAYRTPDADGNPVLQHYFFSSIYSWMCLFNVTPNAPYVPRERKNDPAQTYEAQSSLHSALNHALGSSKGNWLIPALHVVCRNTHRAAALADESTGNRNDHARLQNAVTLLQASYSKTLNDRVELRVSIYFFCAYLLHPHIIF